jgi:hypothetical protein
MATDTSIPSRTSRTVADAVRAGAVTAGSSIVVNLAVLSVATLVGADMVVHPGAGQPNIHTSGLLVAVTVLFTVLAGTLLLIPARRWGARGWSALSRVGLAFGLVSVVIPLAVEAEWRTRVALASMHVITAISWFLVVRRAAAISRTV